MNGLGRRQRRRRCQLGSEFQVQHTAEKRRGTFLLRRFGVPPRVHAALPRTTSLVLQVLMHCARTLMYSAYAVQLSWLTHLCVSGGHSRLHVTAVPG
jgi:hypothetical protein